MRNVLSADEAPHTNEEEVRCKITTRDVLSTI